MSEHMLWETIDEQKQKIADLEKENAELKEKLKPENCLKSLAKSGLVKFTCENGNEHDQLAKATDLLKKVIKVTWGEGWNYSLGVKVEAEQFIKNDGCPDVMCEDCTKEDCTVRKLGLVPTKEIEK